MLFQKSCSKFCYFVIVFLQFTEAILQFIQNKQYTLDASEDCGQKLSNYLIDCVSRQVTTSTLLMASLEICEICHRYFIRSDANRLQVCIVYSYQFYTNCPIKQLHANNCPCWLGLTVIVSKLNLVQTYYQQQKVI